MKSKPSLRSISLTLVLACVALGTSIQTANAGPIGLNTWYTFGFIGTGNALVSGVGFVPGTNPPDGNPVVAADDPAWTITLAGPATLAVLDLFLSIDQFEMFNNLASIGLTSAPIAGGACGSDISCALADPNYSRGVYNLAAGDYSITGSQVAGQSGAGVFQITSTAVPEPASLALFGASLAGAGASLLRRRKPRT